MQKYWGPTLCAWISRHEEWSALLTEKLFLPKPQEKKNLLRLKVGAADSAEHKK
jgi:hypothetical protein